MIKLVQEIHVFGELGGIATISAPIFYINVQNTSIIEIILLHFVTFMQ